MSAPVIHTIFTYGDTERGDLASMKRIIVGEPAEPPQRLVQVGIDHDAPSIFPGVGVALDMHKRRAMEDSCATGCWVSASGQRRLVAAVFDGHGGASTVRQVATRPARPCGNGARGV
jgi:hypothetical protein